MLPVPISDHFGSTMAVSNGTFKRQEVNIYNVTVVICGITEPAQIEICLMNHLPTLTGFARTAMLPPRTD